MEKNKKNEKTYTKKRLNSIILLLAFAAIMLIVSTYAWFSTQRNVTISNLAGTVQVAEGMQISLDGTNWGQELDLSTVDWNATSGTVLPVYPYNTNNIPEVLQPVSTVGYYNTTNTGDSNITDLTFYKGKLNSTGNGLETVWATTPAVATEVENGVWVGQINSETAISLDNSYPGYYAFDVFIKNTIQDGRNIAGNGEDPEYVTDLSLVNDSFCKILEKVTGENNYISEINWEENLEANDIGAIGFGNTDANMAGTGYASTGLQGCVRVGFAVYEGTVKTSAVAGSVELENGVFSGYSQNSLLQTTVMDSTGGKIRQVSIWEPNAELHGLTQATEKAKSVYWNATGAGTDGSNGYSSNYNSWNYRTIIPTFGVAYGTTGSIDYIYNWVDRDAIDSGSPKLLRQNTVQTVATHATEDDYTTAVNSYNIGNLGEDVTTVPLLDTTAENGNAFYIKSDATSRIRIYLWLEGQDVDCLNRASEGHGVQLNIDLTAPEATN